MLNASVVKRPLVSAVAYRRYANLAYNSSPQPSSGEAPTLDRKLGSLEERIQARREALSDTHRSAPFFNKTTQDDATDQSAGDAGGPGIKGKAQAFTRGIISAIPGINNASKWVKQPSVADPEFQVVSAGLGSMLHVRLPSRSELYAAPGAAVGTSADVTSELSTASNPLKALGRRLAGGSLYFQKFETQSISGDVLLAPKYMSDIAAIRMDGTSEYFVRRDAFLARSPRVILQLSLAKAGLGITNFFAHRVTGRGTLAIASYGGIYRLVLAPQEEYLVNPRHLIAWEAGTSPASTRLALDPSQSAAPEPSTFKILNNPYIASTLNFTARVTERLSGALFGKPEFVRLQGPGDFYLCSRVQPSTEILKQITASTSGYPVVFPAPVAPAPQAIVEPPNTFATVTRDGQVAFGRTNSASSSLTSSSSTSSSGQPVSTPLTGTTNQIKRQVTEHQEVNSSTKRESRA